MFGTSSRAPAHGWPAAAPQESAASTASGERPVGVGEFGAILRRRWKTIAASTALVTTLGVTFAFLAPVQFTATTAIFVDPRNRASFQIEGTGTGAGYDPNLVDSQTLLIESDTVLRRVIETEKLLDDSEFTKGTGTPLANALTKLKEAIKVKRPDRTYVVEIQVSTRQAEKSARIANAVARAYLTDGRDSKTETASRERDWLDTHLANLQQRLKQAEGRVQAYLVENKILGVAGTLVGEQQLTELNRGLVDAQRRMSEAKARLDQVESLRRSGRLPDITDEALRSGAIERLRTQLADILRLEANARATLGPRHPAAGEIREQLIEARRLISEELGRIALGARSAYEVARGNVREHERSLERLRTEANSMNNKLLRLRELEREVDAQKAVYERFLRDKEQIARLTVDTPAGRVIEPAKAPSRRSFPNRPLIAALSFAVGLFIGVALALLFETLGQGRSGRSPSRARSAAPLAPARERTEEGLEPLAVLPRIEPAAANARWLGAQARAAADPLDLVNKVPHGAYAREVQALAGRIGTMIAGRRLTTLLVAAAGSESGSPVLAANLARALAQRGAQVLLVDGGEGTSGLTPRLGRLGTPVAVTLGNRRRAARKLPGTGTGTLMFLPNDPGAPAPARTLPALPYSIVLIDGPPIGSRAFATIDLDRTIDGVIALKNPGAGPLEAEIEARLGPTLMGVVGQAA